MINRPLNRYFTATSDETTNTTPTKSINRTVNKRLQQITKEINNLKRKKNNTIATMIQLLEKNASKKKEFTAQLELEQLDIKLEEKKRIKEQLLIDILKSI